MVFSFSLTHRAQHSVCLNVPRLSVGTRRFSEGVFLAALKLFFQNLVWFVVVADVTAATSCFLSDRWFPQLLPSPASSPKAPLSPSYCGEAQNPGTCGAVSVWHRAAWVGFLWKYRAADNLFHSKLTFSISCLRRAVYRYTVH